MPSFGVSEPLYYSSIPEPERAARGTLTSDECVVDGHYFVRACLEIPVVGSELPFVWGVWVSLSQASYEKYREVFNVEHRSHVGPFFGWLSVALPLYPSTVNLKTYVHLRDGGVRPSVELEQTEHPLALEQRSAMTTERLGEIYSHCMQAHGA